MRIFIPPIRSKLASRRFLVPSVRVSRFPFQTLFIYFVISLTTLIFVRYVYALSETTKQMPTDVPFNRGVSGALAGYDNGGGVVSALAGEVRIATSSAWMDGAYLYKKTITLKNLSGQVLTASASAQVTVNTKALFDASKLQNDCDDLRVAFIATQSANLRMQLGRSYTIASGATNCSDSTATIVTFPRMEPLGIGVSDSNYELYYGNTNATAPSGTGYDIRRADGSVASATLVCPFNGSTTCIGQSGAVTPTTATGAIRYSGGKGAMSFDGVNDTVTVGDIGLNNSSVYTVEFWIKPRKFTNNTGVAVRPMFINGAYVGIDVAGNLQFQGGWFSGANMSTTVDQNVWTHFAISRNGASASLYKNGQLVTSVDNASGTLSFSSVHIGHQNNTYNVDGVFDEVRISTVARYASNFTPQTTPFEPDANTKLLLHFDENGEVPYGTSLAMDASGNGNHGTITGAKYVGGLIGVDNSSSWSGAIGSQSYAAHSGIFIEEGTTNLITNPSFEHSTYNTNWSTNYFNYAVASATFTPSMAKRNSAGPFAAGPLVQGKTDATGTPDVISSSIGSQISGLFYQNIDADQGSIVLWITPEWNGTESTNRTIFMDDYASVWLRKTGSSLTFYQSQAQAAVSVDISSWVAGTTYNIVARWDRKNKIDGTNYLGLSVNDSHTFGQTSSFVSTGFSSLLLIGNRTTLDGAANALIEGLTVYRRVLFDGTYGTDVGNGDEINLIYNSGTGKDPTLVTGSWDVVFALPTNASTGALATGTGNAWSHPHASNLLYTSTTNTGGFMMNGVQSADGWNSKGGVADVSSIEFNGGTTSVDAGSDSSVDNLFNSATTIEGWYRIDGAGYDNFSQKAGGWDFIVHQGVGFQARIYYATSGYLDVNSGLGSWSADSNWHHIALTYDNAGDKKLRLYIDGVLVSTSSVATDPFMSDSAGNLLLGNGTWGPMDGSLGWVRISNNIRYSSTFTPTTRYSPPTSDANTIAQWNMNDGTGTTVANTGACGGTASNCNGTLSNGTWNQGGALSTSQKIFSGGYKYTSTGANQGIYRSFTATNGGDYVLRALGHSDGTCNPQVKITRADGTTEISHLNGTTTSTRTAPNVYIFTWESPAAESEQVQLINTAATGTCYWHQVEVLSNLVNNPSAETGSGDPWIPTGGTGSSLSSGQSSQSSTSHSGNYSINLTTPNHNSGICFGTSNTSIGKFGLYGLSYNRPSGGNIYFYIDPTATAKYNDGSSANGVNMLSSATWLNHYKVLRQLGVGPPNCFLGNFPSSTTNAFIDDYYYVQMNDVSLTVTPASQANSTETSGLRVDGADTLTQPITGLSATSGVIKFKWTPRHTIAVQNKFGNVSWSRLATFYANGQNQLWVRQDNQRSELEVAGFFNNTLIGGGSTGIAFNVGTTYDLEIGYQSGGSVYLKINGVQVVSQSGVGAFASVPTMAYFGSDNAGGSQYDGTISNFVALTPTENTAAPYYKFGSKSAKLVNAGTMPDEYTISINPASTATHTLSAYVYDGTTGNVGGTVSASVAKVIFNGVAYAASSYVDQGGGWWRLSYSAATVNQAGLYGVQALAGKTIYADGMQLEQKGYATTYADGSLGTGYSWSGTENNSTGIRAGGSAGKIDYPTTNNISASAGTVSFWLSRKFFIPDDNGWGMKSGYFTTCSGSECNDGEFNVLSSGATGSDLNCVWGATGVPTSLNAWYHVIVTWDNSSTTRKCYVNSVQKYSSSSVTTVIDRIGVGVGTNYIDRYKSDAVISDLRIFNKALSAAEVANLYYEGLSSHASSTESDDRYDAGVKTYTSPVIDLGANGQWGDIPFDITQALHGGTVNYFTRTSADNTTWTDWSSVAGSVIASDPRRYMQWKADMSASADQTDTPVISGLTVRYIEDTTPPVNPAAAALGFANEASTSATLVSGDFANHARPKFTWEEAVDAAGNGQSASGVASYRMLLSTDVNSTPSAHLADPCYVETSPTARSFVVGTSPSTCTLTDNTWYLRLQSRDNSGNVSDPSTIFVYKYDGTAPRAPASVSSTTIGYSADNAFTFFWPSANDDGQHQSGIIYYQYKTGAEDGTYSEWRSSNAAGDPLVTEVSNVEAYQQGQNFFFVRSVDLAGNVSASTTNVGVAPFYYNSDAPTAPTNLQIVPATSETTPATANIFTVTWDKPSSYSGEIAKYYYCVNCTPGATTMTETTAAETVDRTLEGIALATQQGKNTFYIVAEDNNVNTSTGFGNRNFEAYEHADFYTLTVAPGSPQDLSISDASSRTASLWRLTLSWKAPATGGTPARYEIFRSSDDGATYTNQGNTSTVAFTDSELTQGKKYYYKIRAVDNAGSVSLFTSVVSLAPEGKYVEPPSAGGVPSVSTGSTTATVTWTTDRTSYGTIEYGKTSAYGSAAAETTATAKHTIKFTGLAPGTLYHYRVQALDESSLVGYNRSSAYSADYTFTTLSTPTISKVEVSDLSLESAVITWVSSSLTSANIAYGETTAYGKTLEVSVGTTESTHSVKVNSLTHSTTYHFRIKGLDVDGNDIISDDYTFQTIIFPKFTAMVLNTDQEETGTAVVLGWVSNVPTTGTLEYQSVKVDPEYAKKSNKNLTSPTVLQAMTQDELAAIPVVPDSTVKKIAQTESVLQHVERISDLEDGAMYVITVRGRDGYGNEVVSDPIRYVTGADTRPPQMKNLIFETPISGTGPDAKVQIIIAWDTDEPSIGQVAWGEGSGSEYSQLSEKEEGMATKHVIVLRELRPTTSYHLKVISTDRMKNASESQDTVVVTPSAQSAAFDVIIKNLEDIFGFLKL